MALFGSFPTVRAQAALARNFAPAFAYLAEALTPGTPVHERILKIGAEVTERIELGGGVFVLEQAYQPKPRAEGRFESHRLFIDLQAIVAGEELMEVIETDRLRVHEDLTPGRDLLFYDDLPGASVLRLRAGEVAVFFPADAHMPSLSARVPGLVRKAVVKVPVSG